MSHLRLSTSDEQLDPAPGSAEKPGPGALKFASFTPMNDQPGLADRKVTFVIGAGGLLLSTTLFLIMPLSQFARSGFWPGFMLVLTGCLAFVTGLGICIAYRCYTLTAPARRENVLFFQNISSGPASAYASTLEGASDRDALRHVLDFNYTMARLGAAKYRLAGQALLCLRVAIPIWMLLLTVLIVRAAY